MKKPEFPQISPQRNSIVLTSIPSLASNSLKIIQSFDKAVILLGQNYLPNYSISDNLYKRLIQYITQKKDRAGLLFGTTREKSHFTLEHLNVVEDYKQEDVLIKTFIQQSACITFGINYMESIKNRLQYEINRCKEGYISTLSDPHNQGISALQQVYLSIMRVFLVLKFENNVLQAQKLCFYPNTNISLKPIKLQKCKFSPSSLLTILINKQPQVQETFKQELVKGTYGYLSCDQMRLNVIKRNHVQNKSKSIVGLWIYLRNIKKPNSLDLNPHYHKLIWGLITMYITNTNFVKVNVLNDINDRKTYDKSLLLCIFTQGAEKPFFYLATLNGQTNKWITTKGKQEVVLPNVDISFSDLQEIQMQQIWNSKTSKKYNNQVLASPEQNQQFIPTFQRQQDDMIETQRINFCKNNKKPKQRNVFSNDTFAKSQLDSQSLRQSSFNERNNSEKSYDEKDLIIRQLRKQLQFYKERYENLQKMMVNNQTMMQQVYPQIMAQMTMMQNPHLQNPMMGFQPGLNYPFSNINPQIQPQLFQQMSPFHHPMFSSQVNVLSQNLGQSNVISQSSVIDRNQITPIERQQMKAIPPFIKKQSNPQVNHPMKIKTQLSFQQKRQSEPVTAFQTQYSQQCKQTIIFKQLVTQKSIEAAEQQIQFSQKIGNYQTKAVEQYNQELHMDISPSFQQPSKKQLQLNYSAIPIQKSPRQMQDHNEHTIFGYSLAYSRATEQNQNYGYSISNEISQDFDDDQELRRIEMMYKKK